MMWHFRPISPANSVSDPSLLESESQKILETTLMSLLIGNVFKAAFVANGPGEQDTTGGNSLSSDFGRLRSAQDPRILQFALKFVF
jgi:hypothetical protein